MGVTSKSQWDTKKITYSNPPRTDIFVFVTKPWRLSSLSTGVTPPQKIPPGVNIVFFFFKFLILLIFFAEMLPYVHILLYDLKTWFFCQLYMFCGRGGVASGKFLREYWIFYTARRRRKNSEVLGVKMMPHIHILVFFWDQNGAIYTHFFFAVKMLQDIHIFVGLWSKCYHIYTHFGVFWDQNAATYTHLCPFFGLKMIPYIHILFSFIKMLLYIHILFFFGQNAATYTYLCRFLGSKCYHIYTFLEFNFFRKNEKKKQYGVKTTLASVRFKHCCRQSVGGSLL